MTHIDSYALGVCLSENGAFGRVYLAKHLPSKQYCVLKIINKNAVADDDMEEQLREEVRIQSLVNHPNIVQIKEVMEDDQNIYLSVEHALRGDMFDVLYSGKDLHKDEVRKIFHQLMLAVEYTHNKGIIHRDIKLENVLMNEFGDIKLTDFGSAVDIHKCDPDELEVVCGTPEYIAPEILALMDNSIKPDPYNEKIDIWACGIVLYELLCKKHPFPDRYFKRKKKNIRKKLLKHKLTFPKDADIDETEKEFIRQCLSLNPEQRPSASEILKLPWLSEQKTIRLRDIESTISLQNPRDGSANGVPHFHLKRHSI
jgi:5'-AMP-activated protein kinase catalytic alpha subunit